MKIEKKLINKNKIKILYLSMTLFVFLMTLFGFFSTKPVKASKINDYVVLGGDSIGLNLNTNVYVTGKYAIKTENGLCKPWEDSNIEVGDIIYMINNVKINSLDDIKKNINDEGRHVLSLYRDKELVETVISARKNLKGECSLGLYVKDNILGVGTMTYYDLKTKKFASLGHGAIDGSVRNGILTKSYVSGITKGIRGVPGEKKAYLDNKELGVITDNNDFGVFGNLTNSKITGKVENELIKVASRSEVHTGKAIITTVLTGDKKENFEVSFTSFRYLLALGIPMGLQFSITAIGTIIVQGAVNIYGSVYMAGFSAAGKIQNIIATVFVAFGATMATYVGQNRGAGKMDRVKAGMKYTQIMLLIWSVITMIIMFFFGKYMTWLFIDKSQTDVINVSVTYFHTVFWAYPFLGSIFLYRNGLQGLGYGLVPMLGGVFELAARSAIVMFVAGKTSFAGVCLADPAAWIAALIPLIPYYIYVMKKWSRGKKETAA